MPAEGRRALGVALLFKVWVAAYLYAAFVLTDPPREIGAFLFLRPGETREQRVARIQSRFLERLAPYDGQFYLDIAARGYRRLEGEPLWTNAAFFPALPLLLRTAGTLAGDPIPLALGFLGVLSALAVLPLWDVAKRLGLDPRIACAALFLFPTGVFQSFLYTEGLFLFLSSLGAWAALSGRLALASLAAAACAVTRPQGILVACFLFHGLEGKRRRPREWVTAFARRSLALLPPLVALGSFLLWQEVELGTPFAFLDAQAFFGRSPGPGSAVRAIREVFSGSALPLDAAAALFGLGALPWILCRLPPAVAAYAVLSVAVPLASGTVLSMGRFLSTSFPHFLALSALLSRRPAACAVYGAASLVLYLWCGSALISWKFVG